MESLLHKKLKNLTVLPSSSAVQSLLLKSQQEKGTKEATKWLIQTKIRASKPHSQRKMFKHTESDREWITKVIKTS